MIILGIETSCDETGVALYDTDQQQLLSESLYSQINLHAEYGGVVPELASRDHIKKLDPLVREVLNEARIDISQINIIAYTATPGLMGALMVGAAFAKSLALVLDIPAIPIHHLEGHILAPFLDSSVSLKYPFVALLVSGGHTQLIEVLSYGDYKLMGESIDDAAGEAFDKTAKLLGLPYPGGPHLAKLAEKGVLGRYNFPKPMTDRPGLDFSFSGLKTSVYNTWNSLSLNDKTEQTKSNIACDFQEAIIDTIKIKCLRALEQSKIDQLVVVGGVSANRRLRQKLEHDLSLKGKRVIYPEIKYCTDNGAMIALAGALRVSNNKNSITQLKDIHEIVVAPRMPLNGKVK